MPWYDVVLSLNDDGNPPSAKAGPEPDAAVCARVRQRAEALFSAECEAFDHWSSTRNNAGQSRLVAQVLRAGTTSDRSAALTLQVQDSPLHRLSALASLCAMGRKPNYKEASAALESLKELFVMTLLPNDRKLRTFNSALHRFTECHGSFNALLVDNIEANLEILLIIWLFEDALKIHCAAFVAALASASRSQLPHFNKLAMHRAYEVLHVKPEAEDLLLKVITNKLGDPEKAVGSKAVYYIHKLLAEHPAMLGPVADEIELVALHPSSSLRTRFYAAVCCAQLKFTRDDQALALRLIQMYLRLFAVLVKDKVDVQGRTLAAILIGINRALPFANAANTRELDEQLSSMLHVAAVGQLNVAVQALSILLQVAQKRGGEFADRFYRVLYLKMLSRELFRTSRQATFLNLVYRALSSDTHRARVRAITKRLLQLALVQGSAFAAGVVVLVGELAHRNKHVKQMIERAPRVAKDDTELRNAVATKEAANKEKNQPVTENDESTSDGEEDANGAADANGDDDASDLKLPADLNLSSQAATAAAATPLAKPGTRDADSVYQPLKLDPRYARAELSGLFELTLLAQHVHPSVRAFATSLLNGEPITYSGNPLEDFSTMSFLDRFVYRNPKKRNDSDSAGGAVLPHQGKRRVYLPVNSEKFLALKRVRPTDVVFHRFFQHNAERMRKFAKENKAPPADFDAEEPNDVDLDEEEFRYEDLNDEDMMDDDVVDADRAALQPWTLSGRAQSEWARSVMEDEFGVGGDVGDEGEGADGQFDGDLDDDGDDNSEHDEFDEDDVDNFGADDDGGDDDDDGGVDGGFGESDDDDEDGGAMASKKGAKKRTSSSAFADADEFDELLDQTRTRGEIRESEWAERHDQSTQADQRRAAQSRQRGRGGSRGRGSRGGNRGGSGGRGRGGSRGRGSNRGDGGRSRGRGRF